MNPADLQELDTIDEDGRWFMAGLGVRIDIGHAANAVWESEVLARALHPAGIEFVGRKIDTLPRNAPTSCQIEPLRPVRAHVPDYRRILPQGCVDPVEPTRGSGVPGCQTVVASTVWQERLAATASCVVAAILVIQLARGFRA